MKTLRDFWRRLMRTPADDDFVDRNCATIHVGSAEAVAAVCHLPDAEAIIARTGPQIERLAREAAQRVANDERVADSQRAKSS